MKYLIKITDNSPGIFMVAVLTGLILFAGFDASAQKKKKKKNVPEFGVSIGLTTTYDDNILKNSQKYLDRFMNREDEGRFHIDTYDDVIMQPGLSLTASHRIFKNKRSDFNVDYTKRIYVVNDVKNWDFFALGYRQSFAKKASFKFTYSYIPDFYIRHFRDDDWVAVYGYTPETFTSMGFSKDFYGFWVQNTFFKNTQARLSMSMSEYYYNESYTEYDSKDYAIGIKIGQPLVKNIRLELGYELTTSDAKGYDQPGETKQNSNNSDASFIDDSYTGRITIKLPQLRKLTNSLDLEAEYAQRFFTSEHYLEIDPTHAGRWDNVLNLSASYDLTISKSLSFSAFYNYYYRDSKTSAIPNQEYISEEKDYEQNQYGISLKYNFKL